MKNFLSLIGVFLSLAAFGQVNKDSIVKVSQQQLYLGKGDSVFVPVSVPVGGGFVTRRMYGLDLSRSKLDSITISNDSVYAFSNGGAKKFVGVVAADNSFDASEPSTSPIEGLNGVALGTTDIKSTLQELLYPAQPPTAGLSITYGLSTYPQTLYLEYMGAGANLPMTLNWTAGRQPKTNPISTIEVAGENQTFSQPGQGATVTGTKSVSVVRNTNTFFTNGVYTTDNKTAFKTVSVLFFYKRYRGFVSVTSPNDAAIQALPSEFINERSWPETTSLTPTGSQYFVIAFPAAYDPGNISQIWIGGLDQTSAFTRTVRSFTNASGATTNYVIYVSNNPTSGSIAFEIK